MGEPARVHDQGPGPARRPVHGRASRSRAGYGVHRLMAAGEGDAMREPTEQQTSLIPVGDGRRIAVSQYGLAGSALAAPPPHATLPARLEPTALAAPPPPPRSPACALYPPGP